MKKLSRLEKLAMAAPIAAFLFLQGAEINWAFKSYNYHNKAVAMQKLARENINKSDEYREIAYDLREQRKKMADIRKKDEAMNRQKDPWLNDMYWFTTTRINLNEEYMAWYFEHYQGQDKKARALAKKAGEYGTYAEKYGPVSNILKLF